MERSGLGVLRPTGSLSTELEGLDTPAGPRTVALGCHAELHLDPGSRRVVVDLLDDDGRTPMQTHTVWALVGARVDSEAPRVASLSRLGTYGERLSEPRLLDSNLLGHFHGIPWLRADIVDPGAQGLTSLSYTVESLVSGARLELARRPTDRDHADDAWLPVVGSDAIAPWAGDWTSWFGAPGEPAMAVLRVSAADNGLTTTRPYLVELRIRQAGPR
jgi:hypothetical protein